MLVGPAQVAARLAEFALVQEGRSAWSARAAVGLFPIGAGLLLDAGPASRPRPSRSSTARGTASSPSCGAPCPWSCSGRANYGGRARTLNVPARIVGAVALLLFALGLAKSVGLALGVLIARLRRRAGLPDGPAQTCRLGWRCRAGADQVSAMRQTFDETTDPSFGPKPRPADPRRP